MPLILHQSPRISTHDLARRSTLVLDMFQEVQGHFNSRPREEVDVFSFNVNSSYDISTHDLTRRSTRPRFSTALQLFHFNSRPHEEVDGLRIVRTLNMLYFNSRPHEEVDMYSSIDKLVFSISTHDLTRRSTPA